MATAQRDSRGEDLGPVRLRGGRVLLVGVAGAEFQRDRDPALLAGAQLCFVRAGAGADRGAYEGAWLVVARGSDLGGAASSQSESARACVLEVAELEGWALDLYAPAVHAIGRLDGAEVER